MARCWQWGTCRGGVCEKRLGLPRAGHGQLQWTQLSPSDEVVLLLGTHVQERTENVGGRKEWETVERTPSSKEKEQKGVLQALEQTLLCSPWGEQLVRCFWRNCSQWRAYRGVGEKCEEEEAAAGRNCYGLTDCNPHSLSLPHCSVGAEGRGVGTEGLKLSVGKDRGKGVVLIFVFISHYSNLF